jgi:glycosyltransferase involved in cell wall biosynthesis
MKVCIVNPKYSPSDGIKRYITYLHRYLPKFGVRIEDIKYEGTNKHYIHNVLYELGNVPFKLLNKGDAEVYHALVPNCAIYFPFLKNRETVVTFHDMIKYNEFRYPFPGFAYAKLFLKAATYSKHIIAISGQIKKELINLYGVPEDKIRVILEGVGEEFRPLKKLRNEIPTIGYLGGFGFRRHVEFIIKTANELKRQFPKFKFKVKLYGKGFNLTHLIDLAESYGLDNIDFMGFAPENKLVDIYNSFDLFMFPSEYEGFCYPILEAQKCEIPVIIQKNAMIPIETSKCCVRCGSEKEAARKIYNILNDSRTYRRIVKKASAYIKPLNWKTCAEETAKFYKEIGEQK